MIITDFGEFLKSYFLRKTQQSLFSTCFLRTTLRMNEHKIHDICSVYLMISNEKKLILLTESLINFKNQKFSYRRFLKSLSICSDNPQMTNLRTDEIVLFSPFDENWYWPEYSNLQYTIFEFWNWNNLPEEWLFSRVQLCVYRNCPFSQPHVNGDIGIQGVVKLGHHGVV